MKTIPPHDSLKDPVVEILRLAYRRGLALRREQQEKNQTADRGDLGRETLSAERDPQPEGKESNHE